MDDAEIRRQIEELVAEEHRLWNAESQGSASPADKQRLAELKVGLDLCWDLLRQRQAREEFGMDPDDAEPRSPQVVENYEQ